MGDQPASRLARRLGLTDAVVLGMGSMVGAGIFAALAPAAAAAGSGLMIGLAIAGAVAYANATSSAQLAAVYPQAGGTYVYGRETLGPFWGFLAGWCFLVGKTASLSAMALTVGAYAVPQHARLVGIVAVLAATAVNYAGVQKTATATKVIVGLVLATLVVVVAASVGGSEADLGHFRDPGGPGGILEAAGLLFFAFAGYARIATLGEEVIDPAQVIPRAIPIALGITLVIYAAVAGAALFGVGSEALAASSAPLVTATGNTRWAPLVVRAGGAVAALGVLLSLLAGVSRTMFAMSRNGDLPSALGTVHPRNKTPYMAELVVGASVILTTALADLRGAIGFSSLGVLAYYAIANAAAFTQPTEQRRWPRWLQGLGLAGCLVLALSLPVAAVIGGMAFVATGALVWMVRHRHGHLRNGTP